MKRLLVVASVLLAASAAPAFADSMFTFTINGDGHVFQFTAPNPPTVADHPHDVSTGLSDIPGTVDGVGGYLFNDSFEVVQVDAAENPVLILDVSPDPPGIQPPYSMYFGDTYRLFGSTFTTLVSDIPNPYPECYEYACNDLLTYTYALGEHSLYGYDPDLNQGPYTLDITAAAATTVTPEPPGLLLALTGMAGAATPFLRRRRSAHLTQG